MTERVESATLATDLGVNGRSGSTLTRLPSRQGRAAQAYQDLHNFGGHAR